MYSTIFFLKILIKIIFNIVYLITLIYFLFFLTAILSGEFLYKKAIKSKMTFEMRPIELISLEEPFGIRKMLFILHTNTSFNYIYLRVTKKNIIKSLINKEFIMKIVFLWLTGIGWLFIKITGKLIKIRQISLKEQIFIETCKSWSDKLLLVKEGKWFRNGIKKEIIEEFEKMCIKKNLKGLEKKLLWERIEYLYYDYWDNIKKTDLKPINLFYAENIDKNICLHNVAINFHRDDFFVGFLTDYRKAKIRDWYGKEIMINKIELRKETVIIEYPKNELIFKKPGMIVTKKAIIKGAIIDGFNPGLLKEEDVYQIEISKEFEKNLKIVMEDYDMTKEDFESLNNVILTDLTSYSPTK